MIPVLRLTELGAAWQYPAGLKQLDVSHNYICGWPQLTHCGGDGDAPPCAAAAAVPHNKTSAQGIPTESYVTVHIQSEKSGSSTRFLSLALLKMNSLLLDQVNNFHRLK